ncbi:hypothetical protein IEQ34_018189 [Dendrobium chrysotoxum]|uniref:Uncharacterized protein n=1 Tax=Dendrobium chrysotoxum TaxID=161865 RepID=A0AAV7GCE0_DENCH|nr:hypothetical protein IEQ34_018189 [Dendrobium chrysotoxum]
MGRFIIDTQGRATFKSKWLDMHTWDPLKSWAHTFFYVKNDWGFIEKWGRMKDLPVPLHVGEEDIPWILNIPNIEHLLFEVHYLTKYIEEEFLFKVGLSIQVGRLWSSSVWMKASLRGVRLVQRKARVKIDGLTTSQASEDPSSNFYGAKIKNELRKAFSSDDESVDIE